MKAEWKVLLSLAGVLLLLEVAARIVEERLSKDVSHLRSLPAEAERFRDAPPESLKILVLGNSLARCGVDCGVLAAGLEKKGGRPVVVAGMHPDGSRIEEWFFGYRKYFAEAQTSPDVVLLVTGRLHLNDHLQSASDMGAFYVRTTDVPLFAERHLRNVETISQFFLGKVVALFAHRERVEPLVFYNYVPSYEGTAQAINRQSAENAGGSAAGLLDHCETFESFAAELRESGVRLVVVTAPLPQPYQLPEIVQRIARAEGAMIIDAGADLLLPPSRFPDDYHLDSEGAKLLAEYIASKWEIRS